MASCSRKAVAFNMVAPLHGGCIVFAGKSLQNQLFVPGHSSPEMKFAYNALELVPPVWLSARKKKRKWQKKVIVKSTL